MPQINNLKRSEEVFSEDTIQRIVTGAEALFQIFKSLLLRFCVKDEDFKCFANIDADRFRLV